MARAWLWQHFYMSLYLNTLKKYSFYFIQRLGFNIQLAHLYEPYLFLSLSGENLINTKSFFENVTSLQVSIGGRSIMYFSYEN